MARANAKSKVNKNGWLNTYADMVTLILVFFILLYSMSSIDQEKYKMIVKAFTADPATIQKLMQMEQNENLKNNGGSADLTSGGISAESRIDNLDKLYAYLNNYVQKNGLEDSVQIEKGKNMVYVRFSSSLFFEADRAVLKPGAQTILDVVGGALNQIEPFIRVIRIDGHTAEAPPGTSTVDNRELSTDRANAVLKYFEDTYIQDPAKLMAVGYGMYRPVAPNDTEENRAQNRRVEILVAKTDTIQDELDQIYEKGNQQDSKNVQ